MKKTRRIPYLGRHPYWSKSGDLGHYNWGNPAGYSSFSTLETTETDGHAWNNQRKPNTDIGGNFTTTKMKSISISTGDAIFSGNASGYGYKGREFAFSPSMAIRDGLLLVAPSSDSDLAMLGTKAISKCIPTNPVVDGATALAELKSGFPKMIGRELFKTKFKDYRKVGSEYLNVEFGWKPLVSDLMSAAKSVTESEKILEQLRRDSGRNVRRKFVFPEEKLYTEENRFGRSTLENDISHYSPIWIANGGVPMKVTTEVTTKTWFSGCFTYHLDLGNTLPSRISRQAAEARKLYGLELTPATAWNLAPWSWLVDWNGSMGDVLHNVSRFAQDGLVMRYGYIMQQKDAKVTYTLDGTGRLNNSPRVPISLTVTLQSKVRRRATPFGFGFNMNTLNGRQLSILGALGISRGPRHI